MSETHVVGLKMEWHPHEWGTGDFSRMPKMTVTVNDRPVFRVKQWVCFDGDEDCRIGMYYLGEWGCDRTFEPDEASRMAGGFMLAAVMLMRAKVGIGEVKRTFDVQDDHRRRPVWGIIGEGEDAYAKLAYPCGWFMEEASPLALWAAGLALDFARDRRSRFVPEEWRTYFNSLYAE